MSASYKGHNNKKVYKPIHLYIKYLVSVDLIPAEAVVGRLQVGNFTRTALAIDFRYLDSNRAQINAALEDHFDIKDVEEVYKMLEQGAIIAAYHQLIDIENVAIKRFCAIVSKVPTSVQSMLVGSNQARDAVINRFS